MSIQHLSTSVEYKRESSVFEKTGSIISEYFNTSGKRITVLSGNDALLDTSGISWIELALKVSSYILLFPIASFLFAVNIVFHATNSFNIIHPNVSRNPEPPINTSLKTDELSSSVDFTASQEFTNLDEFKDSGEERVDLSESIKHEISDAESLTPPHSDDPVSLEVNVEIIRSLSMSLLGNEVEEPSYDDMQELSWCAQLEERLPCGNKHDKLVELEKALEGTSVLIPPFFGFTHDQIQSLLSQETLDLWDHIEATSQSAPFSYETLEPLLLEIQNKVERDICSSELPLTEGQKGYLKLLRGKRLIIRSSSNEDGAIVNAGGNESIGAVKAEEGSVKSSLARVIKSYFSLHSLKNRSASENPFKGLPLCSALVMEEITESIDAPLPIVSGVMMTTKKSWCASDEEGITHIAASWGFASGTSDVTTCDEWAITDRTRYSTIRHKPFRSEVSSQGAIKQKRNDSTIQDIPCLSEEQQIQLRAMAIKLEAYFKQAMDVEFVIKGGQLYLVQARPVEALNITHSSYLDPEQIPISTDKYEGKVIVSGTNQVLTLEGKQIVFAKNLAHAEALYFPERHKAVIVYTEESSTTHPAVNFAAQKPPVPCIVLPYEIWLESRDRLSFAKVQICPQSGIVVKTDTPIPLKEGLLLHPASFPVTIDDETAMQGESCNAAVEELKQILKSAPEILQTRLDTINDKLTSVFDELSTRRVIITHFANLFETMKEACFDEIKNMKRAAYNGKLTQLAFHAGVLRQLIGQSEKHIVGAHSLSGLEVSTRISEDIDCFIANHLDSRSLCQLALHGVHAFDEHVQRN